MGIPGTHIVMAVFGFVIYELNKCALALTPKNCKACAMQIEVSEALAKINGGSLSSPHALPKKAAIGEMDKIKQGGRQMSISAICAYYTVFFLRYADTDIDPEKRST